MNKRATLSGSAIPAIQIKGSDLVQGKEKLARIVLMLGSDKYDVARQVAEKSNLRIHFHRDSTMVTQFMGITNKQNNIPEDTCAILLVEPLKGHEDFGIKPLSGAEFMKAHLPSTQS
jgi:hypothetical protein